MWLCEPLIKPRTVLKWDYLFFVFIVSNMEYLLYMHHNKTNHSAVFSSVALDPINTKMFLTIEIYPSLPFF